jgi:ammonia channel protein AmtB
MNWAYILLAVGFVLLFVGWWYFNRAAKNQIKKE